MIYCYTCDWKDKSKNCPVHGNDRNPNGTLKSDLSIEDKKIISLIKEKHKK